MPSQFAFLSNILDHQQLMAAFQKGAPEAHREIRVA